MFEPKTNHKKSTKARSTPSMLSKMAAKQYPMDSDPPTKVKFKLDVAERPTAVNTLRFSGKLWCWDRNILNNSQISYIRCTKSENWNVSCLALQLPCPIHWSQVLSWEWRCSWSSADRRCSNYIWVINNFIAYYGASCIKDFMVHVYKLFSVS